MSFTVPDWLLALIADEYEPGNMDEDGWRAKIEI